MVSRRLEDVICGLSGEAASYNFYITFPQIYLLIFSRMI